MNLLEHLKCRSERSYRMLLREIEGITPDQAADLRCDTWPDHRWGLGQDGSICGIVYHVAAWKEMTMPIFEPAGCPLTRSEFDSVTAPLHDDWNAVIAWLKRVGDIWQERVRSLSEADIAATRDWEGTQATIASFLCEMLEHDIQHASQIAYIKQMLQARGA